MRDYPHANNNFASEVSNTVCDHQRTQSFVSMNSSSLEAQIKVENNGYVHYDVFSKSTSPVILPSTDEVPTSITIAPSFI